MGRFVNADNTPSTGQDFTGMNMFCYCGNNPITRMDVGGEYWVLVMAAVGVAIGIAGKLVENALTGNELNDGLLGAAVVGGISGFLATNPFGAMSAAANIGINIGLGVLQAGIDTLQKEEDMDYFVENAFINSAMNLATGTVVKTNPGWFKPQKVGTILTGKYTQKIVTNTVATTTVTTGASVAQSKYSNYTSNKNSQKVVSPTQTKPSLQIGPFPIPTKQEKPLFTGLNNVNLLYLPF